MSRTVLGVDDSPVIRAAAKFALGSVGLEAAEACGGQDGQAGAAGWRIEPFQEQQLLGAVKKRVRLG